MKRNGEDVMETKTVHKSVSDMLFSIAREMEIHGEGKLDIDGIVRLAQRVGLRELNIKPKPANISPYEWLRRHA